MIPGCAAIVKEEQRAAIVGDDDVEVAVVVEIRERCPASGITCREPGAGNFGDFDEFAAAIVVEERIDLLVVNRR